MVDADAQRDETAHAAPTPRLMRNPYIMALTMSRPSPSVPSQAVVPAHHFLAPGGKPAV